MKQSFPGPPRDWQSQRTAEKKCTDMACPENGACGGACAQRWREEMVQQHVTIDKPAPRMVARLGESQGKLDAARDDSDRALQELREKLYGEWVPSRAICKGINCEVWVYGIHDDLDGCCPLCGNPGEPLTTDEDTEIVNAYQKANRR